MRWQLIKMNTEYRREHFSENKKQEVSDKKQHCQNLSGLTMHHKLNWSQ